MTEPDHTLVADWEEKGKALLLIYLCSNTYIYVVAPNYAVPASRQLCYRNTKAFSASVDATVNQIVVYNFR